MSINIATMRSMTDAELINALDDRYHYSPIIKELCDRLQKIGDDKVAIVNANDKAECPICMASVQIEYDEANNLFNLLIDKT